MCLRRRRKISNICRIINAADRPRTPFGQTSEAVDLGRITHLVGHKDIPDAPTREHFGLGHFLTAHTARTTKLFLKLLHLDRFVHLAMCAMPHPVRLGIVAHLLDIALKRIEIENKAWGLNICLIHARFGRDVITHFKFV